MGLLWGCYRAFVGHLRVIYRAFTGKLWGIKRAFTVHLQGICGAFTGYLWGIYREITGTFWYIFYFLLLLGNFWELSILISNCHKQNDVFQVTDTFLAFSDKSGSTGTFWFSDASWRRLVVVCGFLMENGGLVKLVKFCRGNKWTAPYGLPLWYLTVSPPLHSSLADGDKQTEK